MKPVNWNIPFHVFCGASSVAVENVICQENGEKGKDQSVAYVNRQWTTAEQKYSTNEKQCLEKKFRHYFLCNLVVFFVDHVTIK